MGYAFCADLMVALHVGYVSFVVAGQLLILLGWALDWSWVRNLWFRVGHLVAIGLVAVEAVFEITCPLTIWEQRLRRLAGQQAGDVSFVGRLLRDLIFVDVPESILRHGHIGFAVLVLGSLLLIPPHWPGRRGSMRNQPTLK